jgi:ParB-like chromosome segregation protein Spo0J
MQRGNKMKDLKFPVLKVKMINISSIKANDYNPNKVASKEMELLETSILEDGVTMPIVTYYDKKIDKYYIIDGFHRYSVLKKLGSKQVPIVTIEKDLKDRIASTIRHNRARGKHEIELMSQIVKKLISENLSDEEIADKIGMTADELLRLKQQVGIAELYSNKEYSRSWG